SGPLTMTGRRCWPKPCADTRDWSRGQKPAESHLRLNFRGRFEGARQLLTRLAEPDAIARLDRLDPPPGMIGHPAGIQDFVPPATSLLDRAFGDELIEVDWSRQSFGRLQYFQMGHVLRFALGLGFRGGHQ